MGDRLLNIFSENPAKARFDFRMPGIVMVTIPADPILLLERAGFVVHRIKKGAHC